MDFYKTTIAVFVLLLIIIIAIFSYLIRANNTDASLILNENCPDNWIYNINSNGKQVCTYNYLTNCFIDFDATHSVLSTTNMPSISNNFYDNINPTNILNNYIDNFTSKTLGTTTKLLTSGDLVFKINQKIQLLKKMTTFDSTTLFFVFYYSSSSYLFSSGKIINNNSFSKNDNSKITFSKYSIQIDGNNNILFTLNNEGKTSISFLSSTNNVSTGVNIVSVSIYNNSIIAPFVCIFNGTDLKSETLGINGITEESNGNIQINNDVIIFGNTTAKYASSAYTNGNTFGTPFSGSIYEFLQYNKYLDYKSIYFIFNYLYLKWICSTCTSQITIDTNDEMYKTKNKLFSNNDIHDTINNDFYFNNPSWTSFYGTNNQKCAWNKWATQNKIEWSGITNVNSYC